MESDPPRQHLARLVLGPDVPIFVTVSETFTGPSEPDYCTCGTTDGGWTLEIDEGPSLHLAHKTCGKPLLDDHMSMVVMDKIQVEMTVDRSHCHCQYSCDCDTWLHLKPKTEETP